MQLNYYGPPEIAGQVSQIIKLTFKGETGRKTTLKLFDSVEIITFASPKYQKGKGWF